MVGNDRVVSVIAPVTCKLCKLVDIDPRPYLISEAIFSNLGGTATMIGTNLGHATHQRNVMSRSHVCHPLLNLEASSWHTMIQAQIWVHV
jgi:hypothetical protein